MTQEGGGWYTLIIISVTYNTKVEIIKDILKSTA